MPGNRINIRDEQASDFYQFPKVLFWDKEYREDLSDGAKLIYMLIKDRLNLSKYTTEMEIKNNNENGESNPFTYVDDNGDYFCLLDNVEIEFTLNKSDKTVKKLLEELEQKGLIDIVKRTGLPHRIYPKNLQSRGATLETFLGSKDYYKYAQKRKKKKKPIEKTEEEFILARKTKKRNKNDQSKSSGESRKNYPQNPQKKTEEENGGSEKFRTQGRKNSDTRDGENPTPGAEKFRPNNTNTNELDYNKTEASEIDLTSSNKEGENHPKELEEEVMHMKVINHSVLDYILDQYKLFPMKKDRNVIKKALRDAGFDTMHKMDALRAAAGHEINVMAYERQKKKKVKYEPAFFANFLIDIINKRLADEKRESKQEADKRVREVKKEGMSDRLSLYHDWTVEEEEKGE